MSDYYDFDVTTLRKIQRTSVLIRWEMAPDTFLKGKILRPETFKGIHYTGHIIKTGDDVSLIKDILISDGERKKKIKEIKVIETGDRTLFEGLMNSALVKFQDPNLGRCCLIEEDELMVWIMNDRVNVVDVEGDFDFDS